MDRRGGGVDTLHLCRGIYPIIREEAKIESGKRGHVGYARRDACALCPPVQVGQAERTFLQDRSRRKVERSEDNAVARRW